MLGKLVKQIGILHDDLATVVGVEQIAHELIAVVCLVERVAVVIYKFSGRSAVIDRLKTVFHVVSLPDAYGLKCRQKRCTCRGLGSLGEGVEIVLNLWELDLRDLVKLGVECLS